jgi:hypothetical protein
LRLETVVGIMKWNIEYEQGIISNEFLYQTKRILRKGLNKDWPHQNKKLSG